MPDAAPAHDLHARALLAHQAGRGAEALELLQLAARDAVDAELMNDLAVVTAGQGDIGAAAALLRGLLALSPENRVARDNLDQLGDPAGELRDRLLQTVLECRAERPLDNLDHFFAPMGVELPDPAGEGARPAWLAHSGALAPPGGGQAASSHAGEVLSTPSTLAGQAAQPRHDHRPRIGIATSRQDLPLRRWRQAPRLADRHRWAVTQRLTPRRLVAPPPAIRRSATGARRPRSNSRRQASLDQLDHTKP
jgi:hypothetical protein